MHTEVAGCLRPPPSARSVGRVPPTSELRRDQGLPVDWDLAARTAGRLTAPGPVTTMDEAVELVGRLRSDAAVAEGHVREVTGLGAGLPLLPADVVDRPTWAAGAADGMAALTSTAVLPATPRLARAVTSRTALSSSTSRMVTPDGAGGASGVVSTGCFTGFTDARGR